MLSCCERDSGAASVSSGGGYFCTERGVEDIKCRALCERVFSLRQVPAMETRTQTIQRPKTVMEEQEITVQEPRTVMETKQIQVA